MYSAVVRRLQFGWDTKRQALVFMGTLESGFQFEVAFPVGHVALTFDSVAAEMGYVALPQCGDIETVEGFLGAIEMMHQDETGTELGWFGSKLVKKAAHAVSSAAKGVAKAAKYTPVGLAVRAVGKPVSSLASKAYQATVKRVGQQALKYARAGVSTLGKGALTLARSKALGTALGVAAVAFPAVGAPALAAYAAANRAAAVYDAARTAGSIVTSNNIKNRVAQLARSNAPSARMVIAGLKSAPIR